MALFTWDDRYSVKVLTIDRQHSGLFDILNELHSAMLQGQTRKVVGPLLDKLVVYTVQHFTHEERLMEAAKYPKLRAHRARHAHFTGQVKEFTARYKNGDGNLNIELLRFLSDWLTSHILREDQQYSLCLMQSGAK